MSKEQNTIRGQVIECLPNLSYKVSVEDNGVRKKEVSLPIRQNESE